MNFELKERKNGSKHEKPMFNFHLFISYSTFQFITNLHCIKHFLKFFFFGMMASNVIISYQPL